MPGWVKLHRKLLNSCIFQNEKLLKVFIWCLLKATHAEYEQLMGVKKIKLMPGQFIYGRKVAAAELDMKESTVRDYIKFLGNDKSIDIKTTNKYSLITVVNWELYQSKEEESDNKTDNKPTTNRQQSTTNKNNKNNNKIINISDTPQKFTPPPIEEVKNYCRERNNNVDADKWIDFYISKGWMVGVNKMKDWKAAIRTWEKGSEKKQDQYRLER